MSRVTLSADVDDLVEDDLDGFFVGWPHAPTLAARLEIVRAADEAVIARATDGAVVGFATAVTDHRFAAYIALVEVLPAHQSHGIGTAMVGHLLERLDACYMVDLVCDPDVVPFYERLGGTRLDAVAWRNPDRLHPEAGD